MFQYDLNQMDDGAKHGDTLIQLINVHKAKIKQKYIFICSQNVCQFYLNKWNLYIERIIVKPKFALPWNYATVHFVIRGSDVITMLYQYKSVLSTTTNFNDFIEHIILIVNQIYKWNFSYQLFEKASPAQ